MIFGMSSTPISLYLRFARRILINILSQHPEAKIEVPNEEKIKEYQRVIAEKHPSLAGVWCTMDGLKLYLEQSTDPLSKICSTMVGLVIIT